MVLLLSLLALFSPLAHADCGASDFTQFQARPDRVGTCSVEGDRIYVSGIFDDALVEDVAKAISPAIHQIYLNSYGGNYEAGLKLGKLVQQYQLDTVVPGPAIYYCVSACTYVFQSGMHRLAHPNAVFGYHGALEGELLAMSFENECGKPPYTGQCEAELEDTIQTSLQAARDIFLALEKLGASPKLFEMYTNGPDDPDWFERGEFTKKRILVLRGGQLTDLGVVTELLPN